MPLSVETVCLTACLILTPFACDMLQEELLWWCILEKTNMFHYSQKQFAPVFPGFLLRLQMKHKQKHGSSRTHVSKSRPAGQIRLHYSCEAELQLNTTRCIYLFESAVWRWITNWHHRRVSRAGSRLLTGQQTVEDQGQGAVVQTSHLRL